MTTHQESAQQPVDQVLSSYAALRQFGVRAGYTQAPSTITRDTHYVRTFVPALQSRLGVFVPFATDDLGDRLFEKEFKTGNDRTVAEVVVGTTDALKKYHAATGRQTESMLTRLRAEVENYTAGRSLAPETTAYLKGDFINQVALALDAPSADALVDVVAAWYAPQTRVLN